MASGRFIVGIDLGTTHTAMAYAEVTDTSPYPRIRTFEIPQLIRPGAVDRRPLLPSCVYIPTENEFPDECLALPWSERTPRTDTGVPYIVGEFARTCGSEAPGRFISSAKSWLSQPGAKRRSAMLPWNATEGVQRFSPVEASTMILKHLVSAWNFDSGRDHRNGMLADQKIVLCVPASFDAVARDLTMEAAKRAGLIDVTLLEEPQAAFYAWIANSRDTWRTQLHVGDLALIVDVGGGTTDFTLIAVGDERGAIALRRVAVGEHILLGGDNMDMALARSAAQKLEVDGIKLDAWQVRGLALACRDAKERLLHSKIFATKLTRATCADTEHIETIPVIPVARRANSVPSETRDDAACLYIRKKPKKSFRKPGRLSNALTDPKPSAEAQLPLPILGRGAAVIGTSVNASFARSEAERVILDGFLDPCDASARPCKPGRSGLRELGLGYAADPSITKHLAKFLTHESEQRTGANAASETYHPTAILFNGGVMKSELLREHTANIVTKWIEIEGGSAPRELVCTDPDLAVARGAAFFGRVQKAHGVRICGGVPRSYYVGIESPRPAIPGKIPTITGLCVVPFGMDEGTEFDVPGAEFGLTVGEPTQFRFFSAAERRDDRIGDRVEIRQDAIRELEPIETTIPATLFDEPGTFVPVRLKSIVTTVGTLELWFNAIDEAGAWKLELNVREP